MRHRWLAVILLAATPAVAVLDGDWQAGFALGANGPVYAATIFDGELVVGGDFTSIGGVGASGVARWDGSSWHALGSGVNGRVHALVQHGNDLYAGGAFTEVGSFDADNIARWTGSFWVPLGNGADQGVGDVVYSLASYGGLIVGGAFTDAGISTRSRITRWTGSSWADVGGGVNNTVLSMRVVDGILYVGGFFDTAGGAGASGIATWDGSSWGSLGGGVSSSLPFGNPAGVEAIVDWDGGIAVAGRFDFAGSLAANNVATWSGSSWSALGTGVSGGPVPVGGFAIARFRSHLVVAGRFLDAGGDPASRIAAWDGAAWSTLDQGLDGDGYMLQASGRELFAGGTFLTAGGGGSQRIASWLAPPVPSGAVPDGSIVPGTQLTIRKLVVPAFAALDWGESCSDSDIDYAVYVGTLGDFTSHVPLTCSTGGASTWAFAIAEDAYYLVVPTGEDFEGGYGFDGDGVDRPASTAACAVQSLASCAAP